MLSATSENKPRQSRRPIPQRTTAAAAIRQLTGKIESPGREVLPTEAPGDRPKDFGEPSPVLAAARSSAAILTTRRRGSDSLSKASLFVISGWLAPRFTEIGPRCATQQSRQQTCGYQRFAFSPKRCRFFCPYDAGFGASIVWGVGPGLLLVSPFRTRLQAVVSPADDRLPCRLSRNPWPSLPS